MTAVLKTGLVLAAACAMLSMSACADVGTHVKAPTKAVSIPEIQSVAGKWDGLLKRRPRTRGDDYVMLTIRPDGTYEFASARTIGVFGGTGTLQLMDGKLRSEGEQGHATYTLHERAGEQVLMVEGIDTTNDYKYRAELTRTR